MKEIIIIADSREKDPLKFTIEEASKGYKSRIVGNEVTGLSYGDYTFKLEDKIMNDLLIIERKASFQELFNNLCNKLGRERFIKEMEKLKHVKHKYIVVESNVSRDILGMTLPQYGNYAPTVNRLVKDLLELQMDYGVVPVFAGDCSIKMMRSIFETVVKKEL